MPISGRRRHLCPSTELTLGGSKAAKIGSTASCSAAALAPQWRPQPPGVPIGARAGPGAPVGTMLPLGWGPGPAAVDHTRRDHLNSGAP
jgi:hypothetical protein